MQDESALDFNFWPSFADLMLALVLILVLILFLVIAIITVGTVNLSHIQKNQRDMINAIASKYASEPQMIEENVYGISISVSNSYDIVIENELGQQRITFSDKILFLQDSDRLNNIGQEVLQVVGESLKQQLPSIREIQIQGHADTDRSRKFPSNLHLASARAISVYIFVQEAVGISPAEHLMSVTSFGEYRPVQRSDKDSSYDLAQLQRDNSTPESKGRNRRIELLLLYRR